MASEAALSCAAFESLSNALQLSPLGSQERANALLRLGLRMVRSNGAEDDSTSSSSIPQGIKHLKDAVTAAVECDAPDVCEKAAWGLITALGKRDPTQTTQ
jgi:hypothetical protein